MEQIDQVTDFVELANTYTYAFCRQASRIVKRSYLTQFQCITQSTWLSLDCARYFFAVMHSIVVCLLKPPCKFNRCGVQFFSTAYGTIAQYEISRFLSTVALVACGLVIAGRSHVPLFTTPSGVFLPPPAPLRRYRHFYIFRPMLRTRGGRDTFATASR